jgi:regulator of nucleoside diphosphate kinase
MDIGLAPEIAVTKPDLGRLKNMIANYAPIVSWRAAGFLLQELDRARIVDPKAIPPTTVTMDSQVEFHDALEGETRVATLAFPNEQVRYRDSISVLEALGTALLGLSRGQTISYTDQDGATNTITVLDVLHQPEAGRWFRQRPRIDSPADAAP